jgi:hypothetical protein
MYFENDHFNRSIDQYRMFEKLVKHHLSSFLIFLYRFLIFFGAIRDAKWANIEKLVNGLYMNQVKPIYHHVLLQKFLNSTGQK